MLHLRPRALPPACCLALLLVLLPPMGSAAPQPAAQDAYAVGGTAVLPEHVLAEVEADTGQRPVRLAGSDRFSTAVALTQHAHPDGVDTVYLATGQDYADALAATTAVTANRAALLLVATDVLPGVVEDELRRLAPERVYVLGGPAAVADAVLADVERVTDTPAQRLAGQDRFETAAEVARHSHPDGVDTAYLATGAGFADALAASTAVTANDAALLLVAPDSLPVSVAEELARLDPARLYVLGGSAAVADGVLTEVEAATGLRPSRIAGSDRFATAEAIARHAHPDEPRPVYLASGLGFADALAASTAVAADRGVLRLVNPRPHWVPDLTAAAAVAATRSGSISVAAVGTDGRTVGHRADTPVPAASVLKVAYLLVYLQQPSVRGRALTQADRDLLEPMITRSANAPATRIADALGPEPLRALAAAVGMREFAYTRPWGRTQTSARDQVALLRALPDLLPERHRAYALDLLTRIVPQQRWGIGAVPTDPWVVHFKGGWGSGTGAVAHQVALLRHPAGGRAAIAVMTTGSPSHAYGTETVRQVMDAVLATLP